jgi:hypothetical protein
MFGRASKAFIAWSGGLLTVLTLVANASLVHGKYAVWLAVAEAGLTCLVATPRGVWKVPNTPDNVVTDTKSAIAEEPRVKALVAQVDADLHAGAAQAAPWPTATPPVG